jgi:hypothetical protein
VPSACEDAQVVNVDRVQTLVERALDSFDDLGQPVAALLRQCLRIATLRNDYPALIWLEFEAMDTSATDDGPKHLGPALLLHFEKAEANRIFIEAFTSYKAGRSTGDANGNIIAMSIEGIESHLKTSRAAIATLSSSMGGGEMAKASIQAELTLREYDAVLSRVRTRLYRFLTDAERELQFGQVNAEIFDRVRASVDERLRVLAPDALEKFTSAYRRVHEGDPEALSQALTACRRVLKATADAVYPATGEIIVGADGRSRTMSDDKYILRLLQAVSEAVGKHGDAAVVTATLDAMGKRLASLNSLASKGVHAEVNAEEVDTCVVQTYLMVGDVLRLVAGTSGVSIGSSTSS